MKVGEMPVPPPAERRARRRRRLFMSGVIVYANGRHSFDCTIRSLSETGARVTVPTDAHLPVRLYLIHLRTRTAYNSDVVWFSGREAGLALRRMLPFGQMKEPELFYLTKYYS